MECRSVLDKDYYSPGNLCSKQ